MGPVVAAVQPNLNAEWTRIGAHRVDLGNLGLDQLKN